MEVMCLKDEAFYTVIETVIDHIQENLLLNPINGFSGKGAMHILRVISKTTLQKLRDEGEIRFTQQEKKIILYDIREYLRMHASRAF